MWITNSVQTHTIASHLVAALTIAKKFISRIFPNKIDRIWAECVANDERPNGKRCRFWITKAYFRNKSYKKNRYETLIPYQNAWNIFGMHGKTRRIKKNGSQAIKWKNMFGCDMCPLMAPVNKILWKTCHDSIRISSLYKIYDSLLREWMTRTPNIW